MKKFALAAAAAALLSTAAQSADLPARAYTKAPPIAPAWSWTGLYIGGNVGWSQTKSDFSTTQIPGGFSGFAASSVPFFAALGSGSSKRDGFTGGGQIGYNYQFAPTWVVGVEADIDGLSSQKPAIFGAGTTPGGTPIANFTNSLDAQWIATVRGRLGYTFDRSLIYVTGGLAVLGSEYSQTFHATGVAPAIAPSESQTTAGWTIGGGWEYAVTNNWSVKGEYLYARFENIAVNNRLFPGTAFTDVFNSKANVDFQTVRVGANYRF
jgi:outer membrane immunogenic protein